MLASGEELKTSIAMAKSYVTRGIRGAQQIGNGPGSVAHLGWVPAEDDMPVITAHFPK